MSSRLTYGKRGKKTGLKLQPSVEFSPQKQNDLAHEARPNSSDTLESDNAPKTSPFQSPIKKKIPSEATPSVSREDDAFDFGVFDLQEDEVIISKPKRINRTRKLLAKEKPKTDIPKSPASSLSSFFVESNVKPTWSPSRTNSPTKQSNNSNSEETPVMSSFSKTLNKLQSESAQNIRKSPKRPIKVRDTNDISDAWELLSDLPEQQAPKKKTMVFKQKDPEDSDTTLQETKTTSQDDDLISYLKTEQVETRLDNSTSEITPVPESPIQKIISESSTSPRKARNMRTYGVQRTFRLERENEEGFENNDVGDEGNATLTSEVDTTATEGLKTITNLRAQGENAQFLDELNFLIEGIESSSTTVSLLELALKLFDEPFLNLLKNHGLPQIQKYIDINNKLQAYIVGFIACTVAENGDYRIEFDDKWIQLVVNLLSDENEIDVSNESKAVKAIFRELKSKLQKDYSSRFLGLTLLIQNNLFVNKEIFDSLIQLFKEVCSLTSPDVKVINMIMLLFESFLGSTTEVDVKFNEIVSILTFLKFDDMNCNIAVLKVLIVLSVKKSKYVFTDELVDKSIESSIKHANTSLGLLDLGLLINLVEDDNCCEKALDERNIARLYRLQKKLKNESKDYYSLLIGILFTKQPSKMETIFKKTEMKQIASQLRNLNSKGNNLISLQVEEILSKLHKLKII